MKALSFWLDIICTINEAFLLYQWAWRIFPRRRIVNCGDTKEWIVPSLLIAMYVGIVIGLNQIVLTSPFPIVILLPICIISIWIVWKCDLVQCIAITGGYFLLLSLYSIAEINVVQLLGGDDLIQLTMYTQGMERLIFLMLGGMVWFGINFLLSQWLKRRRIDWNNLKYVALMSLVGLIGFLFIMYQLLKNFEIEMNFVTGSWILTVAIGIFTTYYVIRSRDLQIQIQVLDNQNKILERDYERVREIYASNARIYHDMKNHLNAVNYMLENQAYLEAKKYIESLSQSTTAPLMKVWTSIDIIDVILTDKEHMALEKGIDIVIEAQMLPQDIRMEKRDLCALFANLLDNAIEAQPHKIYLEIRTVQMMIFIQIKNDYTMEPKREKGIFVTHKHDKLSHGWGTKSIENVVNKYDGYIEYVVENGEFCVNIILNFGKEKV